MYGLGETTAVQWLPPAQTLGKTLPYLYTQGQACLNRGFFPCQDTPGVKHTDAATVHVPAGLTAVMSGLPPGDDVTAVPVAMQEGHPQAPAGFRTLTIVQPVPIPAYLVALAIGDLASARIGPRSFVWTEPGLLDAARAEFADVTERFIATGEELFGP